MGYVAPVLAASTRIWMGWAAAEAIVDAILPSCYVGPLGLPNFVSVFDFVLFCQASKQAGS